MVYIPNLPFCPFVLLPFCPFALLPFYPFALLPFYPFALLSFCPFVLLPFCPFALLPFCNKGKGKRHSDTDISLRNNFCKQSRSYGWAILLQIEQSGTTTFGQTVKIIWMCRSGTNRTVKNYFLQTVRTVRMGFPVAKETVQ